MRSKTDTRLRNSVLGIENSFKDWKSSGSSLMWLYSTGRHPNGPCHGLRQFGLVDGLNSYTGPGESHMSSGDFNLPFVPRTHIVFDHL